MKQFILLCGLLFLTGCSQPFFITTEETLELQLPVWPPEDDYKEQYPELSKWILKTGNGDSTSISLITATTTSITVTVQRNQPFCATLLPITKTQLLNNQETAYFHPAGFIYPYATNNCKSTISWNQGFLADIMLKILSSRNETSLSPEQINLAIGVFNWNKAQETIEKKIQNSIADTDTKQINFYNPWLIDSQQLLEGISYGSFKSTYLNITGCYSYKLEDLFPEEELSPISPFITENCRLKQNSSISLKKDTPTLLSDCKIFGAIITPQSAKKVSKEIVYLPIYITEL